MAITVWPESDFILSFSEVPAEGFELLCVAVEATIVGAGEEEAGRSCSFIFSAGFATASTIRLVGLLIANGGSALLSATAGVPDCSALMRSLKDTRRPTFGGAKAAACVAGAVDKLDGLLLVVET